MEPSTPNSPDSMGIATEEPQKILGRKKIKIQRIEDDRNRQVTFLKRKNGLLKKAMELGILCDCEVAVVIFNLNNGKLFEYSSVDAEKIFMRYANYNGPSERRKKKSFFELAAAKGTSNIPKNEPHVARAAREAAAAAERRPRPINKAKGCSQVDPHPVANAGLYGQENIGTHYNQNAGEGYELNQRRGDPRQNSFMTPQQIGDEERFIRQEVPIEGSQGNLSHFPSTSDRLNVPQKQMNDPQQQTIPLMTPRTATKQLSTIFGLQVPQPNSGGIQYQSSAGQTSGTTQMNTVPPFQNKQQTGPTFLQPDDGSQTGIQMTNNYTAIPSAQMLPITEQPQQEIAHQGGASTDVLENQKEQKSTSIGNSDICQNNTDKYQNSNMEPQAHSPVPSLKRKRDFEYPLSRAQLESSNGGDGPEPPLPQVPPGKLSLEVSPRNTDVKIELPAPALSPTGSNGTGISGESRGSKIGNMKGRLTVDIASPNGEHLLQDGNSPTSGVLSIESLPEEKRKLQRVRSAGMSPTGNGWNTWMPLGSAPLGVDNSGGDHFGGFSNDGFSAFGGANIMTPSSFMGGNATFLLPSPTNAGLLPFSARGSGLSLPSPRDFGGSWSGSPTSRAFQNQSSPRPDGDANMK